MRRIVKYLILLFLVFSVIGCYSTKKKSYIGRKGLMMLNTEEFARNKPYKPSKLKQQVKKKAKRSLLKRSYKIR
jgi:hypothetical protein